MHKDLASEGMEFHSVTPDSLITVVQGIHDGITSHNLPSEDKHCILPWFYFYYNESYRA